MKMRDVTEVTPAPTGLRRRWTIFIVQHSHIDIGYTEKQELTAAQHVQFMRQAVQLAVSPRQDTLLFRHAQRTRHLLDLLDPESRVVDPERRAAIDDNLMLYAEHTFGYSHPALSSLLPQQVFLRKTKHAVDADVMASSGLYDVLRTRGSGHTPWASSPPGRSTPGSPTTNGRLTSGSVAAVPTTSAMSSRSGVRSRRRGRRPRRQGR